MTKTDGSTLADETVAFDGRVTMAPAAPDEGRVIPPETTEPTLDDPFVVFDEWRSEADRRAFAGL